MKAKVTDITAAAATTKKDEITVKEDNVSLSVILPEQLHDKIRLDTILSKKSIGEMVSEWVDQNVSPQDVSIGLETLSTQTPVREKAEPGVIMKALSILVSRRHYNLVRMEALRQNTTIRALIKSWIKAGNEVSQDLVGKMIIAAKRGHNPNDLIDEEKRKDEAIVTTLTAEKTVLGFPKLVSEMKSTVEFLSRNMDLKGRIKGDDIQVLEAIIVTLKQWYAEN